MTPSSRSRYTPATGVGTALLLLASLPTGAVSYYVAPDVPTELDATHYLPWEVARNDSGTYKSVLLLPAGSAIDGLHRMHGGDWLLSFDDATTLDSVTYAPEDVVRYDGLGYSLYFDGAAAGIPDGHDVDALFLDGGDGGTLVLSFDTPTAIAGQTYEPADLVQVVGSTFSLFLDASAGSTPIPSTANVIGAYHDTGMGAAVVTFDVPTTVGGQIYLPGDLAAADGDTVTPYYADGGWPISSRANGLADAPGPGSVAALAIAKSSSAPGDLALFWGPSCTGGAVDHAIYEGQLGSWYSHAGIDCTDDGGDLTEEITPAPGDRYYLVVPLSAAAEGSYGVDSVGLERPVGSGVCIAAQELEPCP